MENYKNTGVNSRIENFGKVVIANKMLSYIHARVWEDEDLLGGFTSEEITKIIEQTIERYGDEINHFVAVALEKVAEDYMKENYVNNN